MGAKTSAARSNAEISVQETENAALDAEKESSQAAESANDAFSTAVENLEVIKHVDKIPIITPELSGMEQIESYITRAKEYANSAEEVANTILEILEKQTHEISEESKSAVEEIIENARRAKASATKAEEAMQFAI